MEDVQVDGIVDNDLEGFEIFDRNARYGRSPLVTIQQRGFLSLNELAYQALGCPEYVLLHFHQCLMEIQPVGKKGDDAIPVRKQRGNHIYLVTASRFLKDHEIEYTITRRYAAQVRETTLIVDLGGPSVNVSGRRKKAQMLRVGGEREVLYSEYHIDEIKLVGRITAKQEEQGKDRYFASVGFDRKPFEAVEQKDVLPNGLALIGKLFYERIQLWGGTPDFPLEKRDG